MITMHDKLIETIKDLIPEARSNGQYYTANVLEKAAAAIEELSKRVPKKPHGDLIDRDALMDDIIGSMVFSGREVPKEAAIVQKVLDIVGDATNIIPASGGREDER